MAQQVDTADKFQVATGKNDGWNICFGADPSGVLWDIITKHVHGSELYSLSKGADGDAVLVCTMLNLYYGNDGFRALVDAAIEQAAQ